MNAESLFWLRFAEENLKAAKLCLQNGLMNPCLQNAQQAVEKSLKALCLLFGMPIKKTHSIEGLRNELNDGGVPETLNDEECELLDTIYLPSKYPLGSILPFFTPDEAIARRCVNIAERVVRDALKRNE